MWRETGDGRGTTLIATETGLEAIEIEPVVASAVVRARKAKPKPKLLRSEGDYAKLGSICVGTKQSHVIMLLQRPEGATIAEIVATTGWLAHSVRGFVSGSLKKKLRLPIRTKRFQGRERAYFLSELNEEGACASKSIMAV